MPLIAIVNAPAAASALARPTSRLSMIDTGVPSVVLQWEQQLYSRYQKCRQRRLELEEELASRILPISITRGKENGEEQNLKLLQHWVDELDGFEKRMTMFCQSIQSDDFYIMDEEEEGDDHDEDEDVDQLPSLSSSSTLMDCLKSLSKVSWMETVKSKGATFFSAMYQQLLDLIDEIKQLERQIDSANLAYSSLASLSAPNSVQTAVERTRNYLMDATAGQTSKYNLPTNQNSNKKKLFLAAEQSHDLLNQVEHAVLQCARLLEDDTKGLLALLEQERSVCSKSVEEITNYITEWNTLARKHGISPFLLPSCHDSLRQELRGNVEAKTLLPEALAKEQEALDELKQACTVLSQARRDVARRLSTSITQRLPVLGMESSTFEARVDSNHLPAGESKWGVDAIDFILHHNKNYMDDSLDAMNQEQKSVSSRGGKVDVVASSGEKARILLAIECELPGSIRALCGTSLTAVEDLDGNGGDGLSIIPPVAVIYDEIDAHVGGRAAVSLARMLSDQSQSCQVISITHSPSVAATTDLHICIQKQPGMVVTAERLKDDNRRKELARMASGDLATEEAEIFADALMRDGASSNNANKRKRTNI